MSLKQIISLSLCLSWALASSAKDNDTAAQDTIWFDDGAWYCGEVMDSLFHGKGKMVYPDSTIYQGNWKEGLWDGQGELSFPDGDYYSGEFAAHEFSGYGTYKYADGSKYEGYWSNGKFNGPGTMEYADGGTYAGNWKEDMRDGIGVLYDAVNGILYKGIFENDYYIGPLEEENDENSNEDYYYEDRPAGTTLCLTYGFGHIFAMHLDFALDNNLFAGFQLGLNTVSPAIGEASVVTNDESGERITLVPWNSYKEEILTQTTYNLLKISAEFGVNVNRFSFGGALGMGIERTVRNCRSMPGNDSYFATGTLYYRSRTTGVNFAYDLFCMYYPGIALPYTDVAVVAGFSNLDRIYIGIGLSF